MVAEGSQVEIASVSRTITQRNGDDLSGKAKRGRRKYLGRQRVNTKSPVSGGGVRGGTPSGRLRVSLERGAGRMMNPHHCVFSSRKCLCRSASDIKKWRWGWKGRICGLIGKS